MFAFVFIPSLARITVVEAVVSSIKANDINAASLYYSDTEVISESENYFQHP